MPTPKPKYSCTVVRTKNSPTFYQTTPRLSQNVPQKPGLKGTKKKPKMYRKIPGTIRVVVRGGGFGIFFGGVLWDILQILGGNFGGLSLVHLGEGFSVPFTVYGSTTREVLQFRGFQVRIWGCSVHFSRFLSDVFWECF